MDKTTFDKRYRLANFTNEVDSTSSRGTPFTGYMNKAIWQGELSDAARDTMYFLDAVDVRVLAEGQAQYKVRFRNYYPRGAAVNFDSTELVATSASNYGINHKDGVIIEPTPYSKAAYVTNYGAYHNINDLVRDKMDELSYALADKVDTDICSALVSATETSSTVAGAITLYGGTATSDAALADGSVLTPSLINEAEVLLSGKIAYYWNSGVFTASTGTKNPWKNEPTDPFVLIIGQRQKQALRNSGQFINASQYGSDVVISSGEIGNYLGIRVICSNNAYSVAAGGDAPDEGSATTVNMTVCLLMKGRAAYTFVWGRQPKFEAWSKGWEDARGITLTCDYAGSIVHADAIVKLHVSDK